MFVVLGFPTLFDLFQSLQSPKEPYAISFLPSCDCELPGNRDGVRFWMWVFSNDINNYWPKKRCFFFNLLRTPLFSNVTACHFVNYFLHVKEKQDTCLMLRANTLTLRRHLLIQGFLKDIPGGSSRNFTFRESGFPPLGIVANAVGLFGFHLPSCPGRAQILRWPWAEKRTKDSRGLGKEQMVDICVGDRRGVSAGETRTKQRCSVGCASAHVLFGQQEQVFQIHNLATGRVRPGRSGFWAKHGWAERVCTTVSYWLLAGLAFMDGICRVEPWMEPLNKLPAYWKQCQDQVGIDRNEDRAFISGGVASPKSCLFSRKIMGSDAYNLGIQFWGFLTGFLWTLELSLFFLETKECGFFLSGFIVIPVPVLTFTFYSSHRIQDGS